MLYWTVIFFLISVIAAIFGFGGISALSSEIAQVLFFVFIIALAITLVTSGIKSFRSSSKQGVFMKRKYKNDGLNERTPNQGNFNSNEQFIRDNFERERFEVDDQDKVEDRAGEGGQTSQDSFDKNVKKKKD